MTPRIDPIRPTDDAARELARQLLIQARHAALGVLDPDSGHPFVSRIALARDSNGAPVTLVSSLAHHARALEADPRCSLLVGEPEPKGDVLAWPRMTLICKARPVDRTAPDHARLRDRWLAAHPKAALYVDFGDFGFVRFAVSGALLNGGFGRAYRLSAADLGLDGA